MVWYYGYRWQAIHSLCGSWIKGTVVSWKFDFFEHSDHQRTTAMWQICIIIKLIRSCYATECTFIQQRRELLKWYPSNNPDGFIIIQFEHSTAALTQMLHILEMLINNLKHMIGLYKIYQYFTGENASIPCPTLLHWWILPRSQCGIWKRYKCDRISSLVHSQYSNVGAEFSKPYYLSVRYLSI